MANISISSGVVSSGLVTANGDIVTVQGGGTAVSTTVVVDSIQAVSSGGYISDTWIKGDDIVYSGGTADHSVISSPHGLEEIYGITSNDLVAGIQIVSSGGSADETVIQSQGTQIVSSGGLADGTVIQSRGTQIVSSGGSAHHSDIRYGGIEKIFGITSNDLVAGTQIVLSGGSSYDSITKFGGTQVVSSGGFLEGAIIQSGGGAGRFWDGNLHHPNEWMGIRNVRRNCNRLFLQRCRD